MSRDEMRQRLTHHGFGPDAIERALARQFGPLRSVESVAAPTPRPRDHRIIDPREIGLLERAIERLGDDLVQKLGAAVVKFSHPGKTKQTPGIADRLYCFRGHDVDHRIALWWEAKAEDGRPRPGQPVFADTVTACGHLYLRGGYGDLKAWLVAHGLVAGFDASGETDHPIPLHHSVTP